MTAHKNLPSALIAAQKAFAPIHKDNRADVPTKSGGKFSYTYADLGAVLEAVTPALHENGLVIVQTMDIREGQPCIVTQLIHADSDDSSIWSYTPIIWADKTDPQKFGGGITYARRYALMAMLNLNAEDDDGQSARMLSHGATPVASVQQPAQEPESPPRRKGAQGLSALPNQARLMSLENFRTAFAAALLNKHRDELTRLMDSAGHDYSYWEAMVTTCTTPQQIDWVVTEMNKRNVEPGDHFYAVMTAHQKSVSAEEVAR